MHYVRLAVICLTLLIPSQSMGRNNDAEQAIQGIFGIFNQVIQGAVAKKQKDINDEVYRKKKDMNDAADRKEIENTIKWTNPYGNSSSSAGSECQTFAQPIDVNGVEKKIFDTACRQKDGTWKLLFEDTNDSYTSQRTKKIRRLLAKLQIIDSQKNAYAIYKFGNYYKDRLCYLGNQDFTQFELEQYVGSNWSDRKLKRLVIRSTRVIDVPLRRAIKATQSLSCSYIITDRKYFERLLTSPNALHHVGDFIDATIPKSDLDNLTQVVSDRKTQWIAEKLAPIQKFADDDIVAYKISETSSNTKACYIASSDSDFTKFKSLFGKWGNLKSMNIRKFAMIDAGYKNIAAEVYNRKCSHVFSDKKYLTKIVMDMPDQWSNGTFLDDISISQEELADIEKKIAEQQQLEKQRKIDAENKYKLAMQYYNGDEVAKDYEKAKSLFEESANYGHREAQNALAVMYESGIGIQQNNEQAFKWYKKAAEQGNLNAQNNLGNIYKEKKDYNNAFKWYNKAAQQGYFQGQFNVAAMYENGRGVKHDYEKALFWYKKAKLKKPKKVQKAIDKMQKSEDFKRFEEDKCLKSEECFYKKYSFVGLSDCKRKIKKRAKYDFEWTDGWLESEFSHYTVNLTAGTITHIGDKIKFQNGFGVWVNMIYECTVDVKSEKALYLTVREGKY